MGSRNCCSLCELTAARLWTESQVLPMAGEGPCQKEGQEEEEPVTDRPGATSVCIYVFSQTPSAEYLQTIRSVYLQQTHRRQ